MGGNKQFHIVSRHDSDKPLVAAAFDTIADVCDKMFVVLGHRAEEVAEVLGPRRFEVIVSDPDSPMIDSIKAGLREVLRRMATPSGQLTIILQLGDHPALCRTALDQLCEIAARQPGKAVMPTFEGNGGHPVLIPFAIAEQILFTPSDEGLRQFWIKHPECCLRVPVTDHNVVRDIDSTPVGKSPAH
jgi:molybdenum cofactor cytidylyltransferase